MWHTVRSSKTKRKKRVGEEGEREKRKEREQRSRARKTSRGRRIMSPEKPEIETPHLRGCTTAQSTSHDSTHGVGNRQELREVLIHAIRHVVPWFSHKHPYLPELAVDLVYGSS